MKKTKMFVAMFGFGMAIAHAENIQFEYTANDETTITITKYLGSDETVVIPNEIDGLTVTAIGQGSFVDTLVTSVTIPDSVVTIENNAFASTGLASVAIPESVVTIGNYAFANTKLTSLNIPSSVSTINEGAFLWCANLTSLAFADSLVGLYVGNLAFSGCDSLISVSIPDRVTSIGSRAFMSCANLASATLGSGVSNISDQFESCVSLTDITISGENVNYKSVDGVVFDKAQLTLVTCPAGKVGEYSIPLGVENISDGAFINCASLTGVEIPGSVVGVGVNAFSGCKGLLSLTIPDSVVSIGASAFSSCEGLNSIIVSNNVVAIKNLTFWRCINLTNVVVPNGVTVIESQAFNDCLNLASITLGENIVTIGDLAFAGCTSLTTIDSSSDLSAIWQRNGGPSPKQAYKGLIIPSSVKEIGNQAFSSCISLTSVTIPSSVAVIGADAFSGCANLESIIVDELNQNYSSVDGVLYDKNKTVLIRCPQGMTGSIKIPNSVLEIASNAFSGCVSLSNVTISSNLTVVGDQAFSDCTGLSGVYFKGNAPSIGSNAFLNNSAAIYYLPGTTGWEALLSDLSLVLWDARINNPGIREDNFGFTITGGNSLIVVVEASTSLEESSWAPIWTTTITEGSSTFSDADWKNYPSRFYRICWP